MWTRYPQLSFCAWKEETKPSVSETNTYIVVEKTSSQYSGTSQVLDWDFRFWSQLVDPECQLTMQKTAVSDLESLIGIL